MKNSTQQREASKAKEVANEYKKKGYRVILEPRISDLPDALKKLNFQPDIIATLGDTNLVIEVKTFESIKNKNLAELAERIKAMEGWDFELVYTNPKSKPQIPSEATTDSYEEIKNNLNRAAKFLDTDASKEYPDAALLLIWSAVENALRVNYKTYKPDSKTSIPRVLVRDSVILGIIGKNDQAFLESMMVKRNEVSHGVAKSKVLKKDLERLIKLGNSIVEQIA
jgi:hypothetical protein